MSLPARLALTTSGCLGGLLLDGERVAFRVSGSSEGNRTSTATLLTSSCTLAHTCPLGGVPTRREFARCPKEQTMYSERLCHIAPAILIFSGQTGRSLSVWILVLTMGLIALPVQGQVLEGFVEVGGVVFFSASEPNFGRELWGTDGTAAGTFLVKDIRAGLSSSPGELTAVNGALFFNADDGITGRELWKHDPATGMTARVADIFPGERLGVSFRADGGERRLVLQRRRRQHGE